MARLCQSGRPADRQTFVFIGVDDNVAVTATACKTGHSAADGSGRHGTATNGDDVML